MRNYLKKAAWSLAAVAFTVASIWIHYEVKVNMVGRGHSGSDRLGGVEVGNESPDFSSIDIEGKPVVLSDFRGRRAVILDFWATWCAPCVQSMPALQKVSDEFDESGLEVIAVNLGEGLDRIERFMDRNSFTFRVVADTGQEIGKSFGVAAIPSQVVIDADGIVRWVQVGYSASKEGELRELLEGLVQESQPASGQEDGHVRHPD